MANVNRKMETIIESIGADAWSLILSNLDRNEVNNFRTACKMTKRIADEHFLTSRNQRITMYYEDYLSAKYNENLYYSVIVSESTLRAALRLNCQKEILKGIDEVIIVKGSDELITIDAGILSISRTHVLEAIEKLADRDDRKITSMIYSNKVQQNRNIDLELTRNIKKYLFRPIFDNKSAEMDSAVFSVKEGMKDFYPNVEELSARASLVDISDIVSDAFSLHRLKKITLSGKKVRHAERISHTVPSPANNTNHRYSTLISTADFEELAKLPSIESLSVSWMSISNFAHLKKMKCLKSLYIDLVILEEDDQFSGISFLDSITDNLFRFRHSRPSLVFSMKFAIVRNINDCQEFRITEINTKMIDILSVFRCKYLEKLETGCIEVQSAYPVDEPQQEESLALSESIDEIYPVDGKYDPICPSLKTLIIGKSPDDVGIPRQYDNIIPKHLVPKNIERVEYYPRSMIKLAAEWLFDTFEEIPLKSLKFKDLMIGSFAQAGDRTYSFPPLFLGTEKLSVPPYIDFNQTSLLESTIEDLDVDVSYISTLNVGSFKNLRRLKVTENEINYANKETFSSLRDIPRTLTDLDITIKCLADSKERNIIQILRSLTGFIHLNKLSITIKALQQDLIDLDFRIFFEIARNVSYLNLSMKHWKLHDFSCLQYMKNLSRLDLSGTPSDLSGKNHFSLSGVRYLNIDDFTSAMNLSKDFEKQHEFLRNITSVRCLTINSVDSHISTRYPNFSLGDFCHPDKNDGIIQGYINSKPAGMNLRSVHFNCQSD